MKFLIIGDIHIDDKNPISRTDNYSESIFNKLEECVKIAQDNKVDFVVLTGDIFNNKQSSKVSHSLVRRMVEVLKSFGKPVYTAIGNHDIVSGRIDSMIKQPLGVLKEAGVVNILGTTPLTLKKSGLSICMSAIHGVPKVDFSEYFVDSRPEGCDFYTMVCHSEILKERMAFLENAVTFDMLYDSKVDYFIGGHIHDDLGIFKHGSKYFTNIGALSRGSISEYNLKRQVGVLVVTLTKVDGVVTPDFERVNLKSVLPKEQVFNLKEAEALKLQAEEFEGFADKLKEEINQLEYSDIKDLLKLLCKSSNIEDSVYQKSLEYLNKC
jgi:DNA repair protein SbcD/Mre11